MRWWKRREAPGDFESALQRALLAVLDRDLEDAEGLLEGAARLDSESVVPYLALARLYRARGEIGRAIRLHQTLLLRADLEPERRLEALLGLATDFRQGGFLRRAIAAYEEVLAHRPEHAGALRALVRLSTDGRDYERAVELNRRLARVEGRAPGPAEAELLVGMAEAARAEGRTEDARRVLARALRRDRRCVAAWIELGQVEAERGRTKRALAAWKRVPEIDRRSAPRVYPRLAATFAALDRPRDFEKFLRGLLEREPEDVGARLALARALAARGETEEALAEVRRLLEREPGHLEAHAVLGRVLLEADREGEAVRKAYTELLAVLERQPLRPPELFE